MAQFRRDTNVLKDRTPARACRPAPHHKTPKIAADGFIPLRGYYI